MTVDEAIEHFAGSQRIVQKLEVLRDVGLGYVRLGQPSTHLSGGEAQRIKLASHLDVQSDGKILFVFDEPTTGLHVHDVAALLSAFDRLVDRGHTLLVIEHNVHVMAAGDWIIDMGPEGGDRGGRLVAAGTPKQIAARTDSFTGQALATFFRDRGPAPTKRKAASRS
jgi:excinuclease ABC subunit A